MKNEVTGVVKWFDSKKGYGFITNTQGEDVFVHYREVPGKPGQRNLMEGDVVRYLEGERKDGKFAMKVLEVTRS